MKNKKVVSAVTAQADPAQWSEQSRRSVAAIFRNSYADRPYNCRYCGKAAVFTAQEQKHAFEVRKTHIHKQRFLCGPCWRAQHGVAERLDGLAARWAENKSLLRCDGTFLRDWHALLLEHERYGARRDGAKKGMLTKLLMAWPMQEPLNCAGRCKCTHVAPLFSAKRSDRIDDFVSAKKSPVRNTSARGLLGAGAAQIARASFSAMPT